MSSKRDDDANANEVPLDAETLAMLREVAAHYGCSPKEALQRLLREAHDESFREN